MWSVKTLWLRDKFNIINTENKNLFIGKNIFLKFVSDLNIKGNKKIIRR